MRVLIDTHVVLDFLQEREPHVKNAAKLFEQIDSGEIEGFIAATSIGNIYYVVCQAAGVSVAQDAITQVLTDLNLCVVDRNVLEKASALDFNDFEDAVQYVCGLMNRVDVIVTRDASSFINGQIPVMLLQDSRFEDFDQS